MTVAQRLICKAKSNTLPKSKPTPVFKTESLVGLLTLFLGLQMPSQSWAQKIHPDFNMTSLRPPGFDPMVSGLDFLPDGRLVVATWEGFGIKEGSVYLVTNSQSGDANQITYKKFASNLNEPLGVKVVNGEIYLLQKDQLSWLPDKNNDGLADEVKKISSGWGGGMESGNNLKFAMGMVYKDSTFFGGLATAWPLDAKQAKERGCIIQMSAKTGSYEPYACGLRTPNGMLLGPEGELFVTENQGNWVPSSKLLHIRKGHFYGVHKADSGYFEQEPETPPAIWMDHGTISVSPTQPAYLSSGVYKGQMIAGDANLGSLQRYFLEKVNGDFQGCVFKFSEGVEAGANRIVVGPDSALYVGGIGTQSWGGWDWNGQYYGLQRMVPNGKKSFDLLAVRSIGPKSLELEFTTPVGAGSDVNTTYEVRQWFYKPEINYGAGKQSVEYLKVNSAKVSTDKMKVVLDITGMKAKNVVYLKLNGLKSAVNTNSWTTEAWYTQNSFGPAAVTKVLPSDNQSSTRSRIHSRIRSDGRLNMDVISTGDFQLEIRDIRGHLSEVHKGTGSMALVSHGVYATGLYIVTLKNARGFSSNLSMAGN